MKLDEHHKCKSRKQKKKEICQTANISRIDNN